MPGGKSFTGPRSASARVVAGKRGIRSDQFAVKQGDRTVSWYMKRDRAQSRADAINRVRARKMKARKPKRRLQRRVRGR